MIEVSGFPLLSATAATLSIAAALLTCRWRPPQALGRGRRALRHLRKIPLGVYLTLIALILRNTFTSGAFSVLSVIFNMVLGISIIRTSVALAANPIAEFLATPLASKVSRGREALIYSLGIAGTSWSSTYTSTSPAPPALLGPSSSSDSSTYT